MIHVKRPLKLAPADWKKKAEAERKAVIAAYREAAAAFRKSRKKGKRLEFTFPFAVYGDVLLRDALNALYGYKCAYCESYYGGTQPVAVEHYRPKGEVVEGAVRLKPGYYWLAAAWQNLLPSCTDCNSPRRQTSPDGKKVVRGKGNFFPLAPGSKRATSPGQERREKPLLLHPELDKPEKHLEFPTDRERAGIVRPVLQRGKPSPKGVVSIHVYALDRPQLVRSRRNFAERLLSHLRNTRNSERRFRANPGDPDLEQEYRDNIADLVKFLAPDQPYSAMARQIAKAELPGLRI
jgi:hypothetical protein